MNEVDTEMIIKIIKSIELERDLKRVDHFCANFGLPFYLSTSNETLFWDHDPRLLFKFCCDFMQLLRLACEGDRSEGSRLERTN